MPECFGHASESIARFLTGHVVTRWYRAPGPQLRNPLHVCPVPGCILKNRASVVIPPFYLGVDIIPHHSLKNVAIGPLDVWGSTVGHLGWMKPYECLDKPPTNWKILSWFTWPPANSHGAGGPPKRVSSTDGVSGSTNSSRDQFSGAKTNRDHGRPSWKNKTICSLETFWAHLEGKKVLELRLVPWQCPQRVSVCVFFCFPVDVRTTCACMFQNNGNGACWNVRWLTCHVRA